MTTSTRPTWLWLRTASGGAVRVDQIISVHAVAEHDMTMLPSGRCRIEIEVVAPTGSEGDVYPSSYTVARAPGDAEDMGRAKGIVVEMLRYLHTLLHEDIEGLVSVEVDPNGRAALTVKRWSR